MLQDHHHPVCEQGARDSCTADACYRPGINTAAATTATEAAPQWSSGAHEAAAGAATQRSEAICQLDGANVGGAQALPRSAADAVTHDVHLATYSRTNFPAFPYKPYDIQLGFMRSLYDTLETGSIGLLESPTGTGKTISIICSALQWQADHRERQHLLQQQKLQQEDLAGSGDGPDWFRRAAPSRAMPTRPEDKRERAQRRRAAAGAGVAVARPARQAANLLSSHDVAADHSARSSAKAVVSTEAEDGLDEFLLTDAMDRRALSAGSGSSSDSDPGVEARRDQERDTRPKRPPQIIFCSRTHSQLTQFAGELRRTPFASTVSVVTLASRKALCINDDVRGLGATHLMNERCMDLQQQRGGGAASKAPRGTVAMATAAAAARGASAAAGGAPGTRKARGGCPHLLSRGSVVHSFEDEVLTEAQDVEDLVRLGRHHGVCPYYGARRLLPEADLVLLPYSSLVQEETRRSLGIHLEGAVVIFDEAHNLVDAVNSAHSATVTGAQLACSGQQLEAYMQRFGPRLSAANAQRLQTLTHVVTRLAAALQAAPAGAAAAASTDPAAAATVAAASVGATARAAAAGVCARLVAAASTAGASPPAAAAAAAPRAAPYVTTANELLFQCRLDNVNMFPLLAWVKETKLLMKVSGFTQRQQAAAAAAAAAAAGAQVLITRRRRGAAGGPALLAEGITPGELEGHGSKDWLSGLHAALAFAAALTHADADGRVFVSPPSTGSIDSSGSGSSSRSTDPADAVSGGSLRYVLLNASAQFYKVLQGARSVVLASGTLAPVAGLAQQLFPSVVPERLRHYACGHIVHSSQLVALVAATGPSGRLLDLRHHQRDAPGTIDEVGRLLLNVCTAVPHGVVAFAPSFSYLEQLSARWAATGLLASLSAKKTVLREPRASSEVEAVLRQYANCIRPPARPVTPSATAVGCTFVSKLSDGGAYAGGLGGSNGSSAGSTSDSSGGRAKGVSGALLLSVVGGKLSEGINFGDELGRCVVVIGMPFANPADPELRERMSWLDAQAKVPSDGRAVGASASSMSLTGRQYYEDLCMKAVNQCVGRVIRHQGDHAAIVLADARYLGGARTCSRGNCGTEEGRGPAVPLQKLPGWIQASGEFSRGDFPHLCRHLHAFFRRHAKHSQA